MKKLSTIESHIIKAVEKKDWKRVINLRNSYNISKRNATEINNKSI